MADTLRSVACGSGLSEGTETGRNPGASLTAGAGLEVALPGRLSFRCINEAMEAAVDGDRILLLRYDARSCRCGSA